MVSLIIFPGYYIPHIGGLETHVDEFVKHLSKERGYQITIFAPRIPPNSPTFEMRWNDVKVYRYPAFEIISNYPLPKFWNFQFYKMWRNLKKQKFNLVMTRTRFFFNSLLGYIFAKWRFNKLKLIHVEHGSSFVMLSSRWKMKLAKLHDLTIGKLIFKKADKVIAISQAVKRFVNQNFLKNKEIPVIYRGIETEEIDKIKPSVGIKKRFSKKIKFLYVGRLYKWKGVENSILAIKQLPEEVKKKIVFLIVGYGEDYDGLVELTGQELNKTIFFLGKKSFEESIAIMKLCDYYLHSSYPGGGLNSSLLQARYCGCLPIASPYEGGNEVVNNLNGFLLKENNPEKIKDVILKINKKGKIKKNERRNVLSNFDWDKTIKKYKQIFQKCAA